MQGIKYNQEREEIFLYESYPDLVDVYEYHNCFHEIENINEEIGTKRYKILRSCKKKKNRIDILK